MRNILLSAALIPSVVFGNINLLKKEIELKSKTTLISISENHLMNAHMFLCGRHQAFFEVLELIEEMENAKKEERN